MNLLYARHCAKGFLYTISFNSHNRKIRKGRASWKSQGQAANKWWNWDLSCGLSDSNAFAVFTELAAPVTLIVPLSTCQSPHFNCAETLFYLFIHFRERREKHRFVVPVIYACIG